MAEGHRAATTANDLSVVSSWLTVDQALISKFAEATLDADPMHVDPVWAATKGPFGKTVAFGFLIMSLLTYLMHDATRTSWATEPDTEGYYLNYGFDRMRLVTPVPVDSRIRARFETLERAIDEKGRWVVKFGVEVEIEGQERPALVGEWLTIWVPPPSE
jgi:acyl dehydratase